MRCGACGHENRETAAFCESCGSRQAPTCSRCAAELRPGARFCDACGHAQVSPASPAATSTPRSYTPRHLAEKILAGRDALSGERKQVTVLFADVVGSTELIQGRDAEEAQALLDGVVQVMIDAVHRYEGTVSRLMGDGLMAMFGAPVAHEDHAVRACYAALAMLDGVRRHGEAARRAYGITPTIRVGLSAGEVVVRTIRDDLHMDYTAMGQTVHLASRMEQLATPGTAALTAETLALVEGYVQVRSLGPVPIKGLPEPVEAFELTGTGQAQTRLQVAASRGLTRFVGRDLEIAALHAALTRAGSGQGQVAALVGEPGVGKSRLIREVTDVRRAQGWTVLEVGAVSYGTTTPYLPVVSLIKRYCGIEPSDDHDAIREKIGSKVRRLGQELLPTVPAFLALLEVVTGDNAWEALDPTQRLWQTLDAVKRLLLRESREQPLLLVFEDLHWIDSETQALLDSLVESLPSARIMLLVNFRPEYTHAWGSRSCYTQLRIDPLGQQTVEELLDGLLGDDPSASSGQATLAPLRALLTRRTEGNPLFLEESVRSLVETGLLVGERGAYRLSRPVGEVRVPATVQAVLAARIDRLPSDAKQLLQTAAVIGKDVPDALLRAVADHDDDGLRRELAVLQASEFLYEASLFPELEYTFKHALTQDVAYGSLLQQRRKTIHGRVLDALERLHPDRLDEHVERLAHHALRAERWPAAVTYAHAAGQKAIGRSALREALGWFEQVLTGLKHLPKDRHALERAIDVRLDMRLATWQLGAAGSQLEYLVEAEQIAAELGDRRRQAGVGAAMTGALSGVGRHEEGIDVGQQALDLAEQLGDHALRAFTLSQLGDAYRSRGDLRLAANAYRRCIDAPLTSEDLRRFAQTRGTLRVRSHLVWVLGDLGDFDEAIAQGLHNIRSCEESGDPASVVLARNTLVRAYLERGDAENAVSLIDTALPRARALDDKLIFAWALALRGASHTLAGQGALALPLLQECMEVAATGVYAGNFPIWAMWLGEAYLANGRITDARQMVTDALTQAVAQREGGNQVFALRALGEIAAAEVPPAVEEAERYYREALVLAEEVEMRPLQARCHLGLAKLFRRIGRTEEARAEEARAELVTAITMLRDMEMAFWLPEAEAELAGLPTAPAPAEQMG